MIYTVDIANEIPQLFVAFERLSLLILFIGVVKMHQVEFYGYAAYHMPERVLAAVLGYYNSILMNTAHHCLFVL